MKTLIPTLMLALAPLVLSSANPPAALAPNERLFPADSAVQVWVPGGAFTMGVDDPESPDRPDERPPHRVTVSGFWMDKYEVTCGQYVAYYNARFKDKPRQERFQSLGCILVEEWPDSGITRDPQSGELRTLPQRERWPVLVTWVGAQLYCEAMGKALPSEAQWEWAARGPDGRRYPWGNQWDAKRANVATLKMGPVGSFSGDVSPFGIFDMAGGVREFCADKYDPTFYQKSPGQDPLNWQGTWQACDRAIRGGGCKFTEWDSRTTSRGKILSIHRAPCTGFRCIAAGPPPK